MALLTIPEENRRIESHNDIVEYLAPLGIQCERWPLDGRCDPDGPAEEVLAAYEAEIAGLKRRGGYLAADVLDLAPPPGTDRAPDAEAREHKHAEDEVRFVLKGRALFYVAPEFGPVFALQAGPGDL